MLELNGLNYWAIIVAWLITVVIGSYWYSPAGFGKLWAKLSGVHHMKIPEGEATRAIVSVAISAVVQVFVLALVLHSLNITTVGDGLVAGLVLWLGLTAATTVGNTLYQRLSWKFWWLNSAYFLIVMSINSVLFAVWQ